MKVKTTWVFVVLLVVLMYTNALGPAIGFVTDKVMGSLPMPDSSLHYIQARRGWAEIDANEFPAAEQSFSRALEINPYSSDCYGGRARARAEQGNWQGALEDANRAIDTGITLIHPEYFEVRARILDALGRPADANADRERAASLRAMGAPRPSPARGPSSAPESE